MPTKTNRKKTASRSAKQLYEIKITLLGSKPTIWRRVVVPEDIKLRDLHDVIQIAMGWTNSHLHQFQTPDNRRYGMHEPAFGLELDEEAIDENKVHLSDLVDNEGYRFVYEYDFGDGWEHGLEIVKIRAPGQDEHYPACLSGERACPPEDCGGVWGYEELLATINDPTHTEHDNMVEWLGGGFDPEAFDLDEVNDLLQEFR